MSIFGPRPSAPRPTVKKQKQSSGPPSFFEEKKSWRKGDARRRLSQKSRLTPGSGGRYYKRQEIGQILDKRFPWGTDKGFVSRRRAIRELKKMRMEEHRARTGQEKRRIKQERDFLTQGFGLKGKY